MADKIYNVLFVCTGNSARSILAESLLNGMAAHRFTAWSAGSHPKGEVHPLALQVLAHLNLPLEGLRSKSCPVWPGQPITAHWGVHDPAAVTGPPAQQQHAFEEVAQILKRRIDLMLSLPAEKLAALSIQADLNAIGKL